MDGYVSKPIRVAELYRVIDATLTDCDLDLTGTTIEQTAEAFNRGEWR